MSNELENIILTICPHEEANKEQKTQTKIIETWALLHGVCDIQYKELPGCDIRVEGDFRGVPMNVLVERKSWDNFLSDPIDDIEDKLLRAQEYGEVALFVEQGNYTFKPDPTDLVHCTLEYTDRAKAGFRLLSQKVGKPIEPPVKTLAAMEGFFDTLSSNGIHVRTLRSEAHFPYALHNLLIYLTKPHKLKLRKLSYEDWLTQLYTDIPEVGIVRAKKMIASYPNPFWLCSASDDSLIRVLGKTTGQVVYQHLHNHELETDTWKRDYNKDGTQGNNAEPEPVRTCPKCGKDTEKSACPRCEAANQDTKPRKDRTNQETYIKQSNICSSMACLTTGNDVFPCDDPAFTDICRLEQKPQRIAHLCKTCTLKPKSCGATNAEKKQNYTTNNVIECKRYENKYPPKPMSPEAQKHQDFKRRKAGFQPKGTCETCDHHITEKLICKMFPEKRAEKHFKACVKYIQKKVEDQLSTPPNNQTCVACTDEEDMNTILLINGICPICKQDYNIQKPSQSSSPMSSVPLHRTPDNLTSHAGVEKNVDASTVYTPDNHSSHTGGFYKVTPQPNTPSQSPDGMSSAGSPGTKGSPAEVLIKCEYCGAESDCCAVGYYKRHSATLCQSCARVEDQSIKDQHIEIAEEVLKYLRQFPEGKLYSEICQHFDLAIGSPDCKDMRNCLKKMGEAGLITSEHGVFIAVETKDTTQDSHIAPASGTGAVSSFTPLTPSHYNPDNVTDLDTELRTWFCDPHTLDETAKHILGSSRERIFNAIMQMEERGTIMRIINQGTSSDASDEYLNKPTRWVLTPMADNCQSMYELESSIIKYCIDSHVIEDIISRHGAWDSDDIKKTVNRLTEQKKLTKFEELGHHHDRVTKWIIKGAVKAEPEMDIGV